MLQAVDADLLQDVIDGMYADAVLLKHLHIVLMLLSGHVHVEVVLEKSCCGVDDTIEQFLARRVHQYVACFTPLGLWVGHLHGLLCPHAGTAEENGGHNP